MSKILKVSMESYLDLLGKKHVDFGDLIVIPCDPYVETNGFTGIFH